MLLIIGLGNIGEEYLGTFHNVGFMCVEALAAELNLKFKKLECRAITAVKEIGGEKVVLAKPTTYMNLSGEAVKSLMQKYKAEISDIIVLVDDLDLPLGTIRLRESGSAGAHNGLRNIVELLGSTEFKRIRVGIGKPMSGDIKDYVLSKINSDEAPFITLSVKRVKEALSDYIKNKDFAALQHKYNRHDEQSSKS